MGTNYYLVKRVTNKACPTCGYKKETKPQIHRHIGKSSGGWHFLVHVEPYKGIYSLDDILPDFFNSALRIEDEYGKQVTPAQMCNIIMGRRGNRIDYDVAFLEQNYAEVGLNGLLRCKKEYCFGWGEGTWDYFTGEFS